MPTTWCGGPDGRQCLVPIGSTTLAQLALPSGAGLVGARHRFDVSRLHGRRGAAGAPGRPVSIAADRSRRPGHGAVADCPGETGTDNTDACRDIAAAITLAGVGGPPEIWDRVATACSAMALPGPRESPSIPRSGVGIRYAGPDIVTDRTCTGSQIVDIFEFTACDGIKFDGPIRASCTQARGLQDSGHRTCPAVRAVPTWPAPYGARSAGGQVPGSRAGGSQAPGGFGAGRSQAPGPGVPGAPRRQGLPGSALRSCPPRRQGPPRAGERARQGQGRGRGDRARRRRGSPDRAMGRSCPRPGHGAELPPTSSPAWKPAGRPRRALCPGPWPVSRRCALRRAPAARRARAPRLALCRPLGARPTPVPRTSHARSLGPRGSKEPQAL